ncbi:hypothetical protein [Actinokineospora iranica]|uniref:Putative DNA-invertase from lambdoid prophage Rac n=1 Tax=Actinokineospora iranica TaxID=1271860 RepID=A0A1G6WSQ6_9PSEU|nr:hypothetical protein [Actinokineospora iranica]SDD68809.1 putative DNA-invertase from lambdoid prophage Rac [Actinokineospora iranica]
MRVEIPGEVAHHLTEHADLGDAERYALRQGRTVRRGQGYSLHVTAVPDVHKALVIAATGPNTDKASSAERKVCRIYTDRLNNAVSAVPA